MQTAELVALLAGANATAKHALACALELHLKPIGLRIEDALGRPLVPFILETLDVLEDLAIAARKVIQAKEKE